MNKKAPYIIEMSLCVLLAFAFAFSFQKRTTFLETASLKTYDWFSGFVSAPSKNDAVKIVDVDEESLANLGRWPWPRGLVAQLIDAVVMDEPKVIGLNVLFTDANQSAESKEIAALHKSYASLLNQQ